VPAGQREHARLPIEQPTVLGISPTPRWREVDSNHRSPARKSRILDKGQRVEVRVVLHGVTATRLRDTCAWLARNLPFVDHVALMGLENTGFALANKDSLWIDPLDYQADLACGVDTLRAAGVSREPARQPKAVAAGLEGSRDPRDRAAGPDRLILPAMQQTKQPFWARLHLLARLTANAGKHAGNQPARLA
jgi:hypothetical protein